MNAPGPRPRPDPDPATPEVLVYLAVPRFLVFIGAGVVILNAIATAMVSAALLLHLLGRHG